jgi:hypothetical protein
MTLMEHQEPVQRLGKEHGFNKETAPELFMLFLEKAFIAKESKNQKRQWT